MAKGLSKSRIRCVACGKASRQFGVADQQISQSQGRPGAAEQCRDVGGTLETVAGLGDPDAVIAQRTASLRSRTKGRWQLRPNTRCNCRWRSSQS